MLTKKQLVSQFYHSIPVRVTLISLIVAMTFFQYEHLFFALFVLNIPHFFISSYRKSKRPGMDMKLFYTSEISSILAAVILALVSTKLLLYVTFFRFTLHFFEDEHFNIGFRNTILSVLLFLVFSLEDFPALYPGLKFGIVALALVYFLFSIKEFKKEHFLNYYPVYLLLLFVPLLLNKTFNSSTWGYNLGILHSLMWLSWEGFGRSGEKFDKFNVSGLFTSSSMIITLIFTILTAVYVGMNNWDFQPLMKNFLVIFYVGLFSHVASDDFYKLYSKLSR